MNRETLSDALARFETMKTKPTKWQREAIARYAAAIRAGEIEYPRDKGITRGKVVMLGGRLLVKERMKQLEKERIERMKKLEDEASRELDRLGAYFNYPSMEGFIVITDKRMGVPILYTEGFEVQADDAVLEALRRLSDKAGVNAVVTALESYQEP